MGATEENGAACQRRKNQVCTTAVQQYEGRYTVDGDRDVRLVG